MVNVSDVLSKHRIESVMLPKNMAHLLQPLDLTANAILNKVDKWACSKYFNSSIMEALKEYCVRLSNASPFCENIQKFILM